MFNPQPADTNIVQPLYITLNKLGIDYRDCWGDADIQRRFDEAMVILAAVRAGVHLTPGTYGASETLIPFTDERVIAESTAISEFRDHLVYGDLKWLHAKADEINAIRSELGWPRFVPPADLQILLNARASSAANLLRRIMDQVNEGTAPIILDPVRADAVLRACGR